MAETTADVRRDIEMTRERMSSTLAELEERLNVMQFVKDHPWPAIAVAAGAGFALSGSGADVKAAAATATAAHAATDRTSRLGPGLDEVVARLLGGVQAVLLQRADELVEELRGALGVKGGAPGSGGMQHQARPDGPQPDRAAYGASPSTPSSPDAYGSPRQVGAVPGGTAAPTRTARARCARTDRARRDVTRPRSSHVARIGGASLFRLSGPPVRLRA